MTEVSSCSRSYSWKGGSNTIWKNFPNRSIAIVDDIASAKKGYLSASFVYLWLYKIIRTITNLHTPDLLFQIWQPCAQDNLGDLHKLFRSHKINQMNSFWSLCVTSINLMTPRAFCQKRIFLDILEIFSLNVGQISSNLLKKVFAKWQYAFLSASIAFLRHFCSGMHRD